MAIIFDGPNKTIILSSGTTVLQIKELWSRWVDWVLTGDNGKYLFAMRTIGGETIALSNNSSIPVYVVLQHGWKIRPQEADHTLDVTEGVLITDDQTEPFIRTIGTFNVRVNYQQPITSIAMTTGGTAADLLVLNNKLDQLNTLLATIDVPTAQENAQALLNSPVDSAASPTTIGGYITKVLLTVPRFLGLS